MKRAVTTLLLLAIASSCAQEHDPEPEPEEFTPRIGEVAPNFRLKGTAGSVLALEDVRELPHVLVFYGGVEGWPARRVLWTARDRHEDFVTAGGRLGLVGQAEVDAQSALAEATNVPLDLFEDERGKLQSSLGLDPAFLAWALLDSKGILRDTGVFDGASDEGVREGFRDALGALRSLRAADPPGFVEVLGAPLSGVRDLVTLSDARCIAITADEMLFLVGRENVPIEIEGGGLSSIMVDGFGVVHLVREGKLHGYNDHDGIYQLAEPVRLVPEEGLVPVGGTFTHVAPHPSGALIAVHDGKLVLILPATMRVVPAIEEEMTDVLDILPASPETSLVVSGRPPFFQVLEGPGRLRPLTLDEKVRGTPTGAACDAGGRIFTTLRNEREVHVLDGSGQLLQKFPARGGGVEGVPLMLSHGAGFLDVLVKDDASGELRVLRFVL